MGIGEQTEKIISDYLSYTGRKAASVSVKEYLCFREMATAEYMNGLTGNESQSVIYRNTDRTQSSKKIILDEHKADTDDVQDVNDDLMELMASVNG